MCEMNMRTVTLSLVKLKRSREGGVAYNFHLVSIVSMVQVAKWVRV